MKGYFWDIKKRNLSETHSLNIISPDPVIPIFQSLGLKSENNSTAN